MARAFEVMRQELADTDRQRRELVANASHELRTPLTALQARLENMADGVEAVDKESLESALVQVRDLGSLVSQLLDLTRLESGRTRLDREPLDLAELSGEIVGETSQTQPRVDFRVTASGATEIRADRLRVGQVLRNLLTNAVRHAPDGSVISVHAGECPDGVEVVVADSGPGVAPGEEEKIFERFHHGSPVTEPGQLPVGSGLGLAITRSIVELHGGSVWVEPNDPVGCRAVVRLPAA